PEFDAVQGTKRLQSFTEMHMYDLGNPHLQVDAVITNNVRPTSLHEYECRQIEVLHGVKAWSPRIPQRATLTHDQDSGEPQSGWRNKREVRALYDDLAGQVEEMCA